jgi:hypothetical protein
MLSIKTKKPPPVVVPEAKPEVKPDPNVAMISALTDHINKLNAMVETMANAPAKNVDIIATVQRGEDGKMSAIVIKSLGDK